MSKQYSTVLITAPSFGTGREKIGGFTGYDCGYCHGEGWLWNPEIIHERVKMPCPKCKGTGKVMATVTIEWTPFGEVKPNLKNK